MEKFSCVFTLANRGYFKESPTWSIRAKTYHNSTLCHLSTGLETFGAFLLFSNLKYISDFERFGCVINISQHSPPLVWQWIYMNSDYRSAGLSFTLLFYREASVGFVCTI